jgi:hypothetical protein
MAQIAPWLVPPNYSAIMEAGAQTGLAVRRQTESEADAGDRLRLAYDTLAAQERRAAQAAADRKELTHASLALRAQQADAMNAYRMGSLQAREESEARHRDNMTRLAGQFQQTLAERQAREERLGSQFQTKEDAVNARAEDRLNYLKDFRANQLPPAARALLNADVSELRGIETKLSKTEPHKGIIPTIFGTSNTKELADLNKRATELRERIATQYGPTTSTGTAPGGAAPAAGGPKEVIRLTKDGRKAVFDASTKQFIRYAE